MIAGRVIRATVLAAVGFLMPISVAAQGVSTFAVEGEVSNGTRDAPGPWDVGVQLVALTGRSIEGTWDSKVDESGRYRFESVPLIQGASYVVGVDYSGATYAESLADLPAGGIAVKDLKVYESVQMDPGVLFEQSAIVVSDVDPANRSITMLEIHSVVNPTDRTFIPSAAGPGGPAGLLVFGLPANAFALTPELGLDMSRMVQIDRGFASLGPVVPGRNEIAFYYQFPYSSAEYLLQRTIRYPVHSFRVLAPDSGPSLASEDLSSVSSADIAGRQYETLTGGPFQPGTVVNVTLRDLPATGATAEAIPPWSVAGAGVAVGFVLVLIAWAARRGRPAAPSLPEISGAAVERIVALDLKWASGVIDETAYHSEREELLDAAAREAVAASVGKPPGLVAGRPDD